MYVIKRAAVSDDHSNFPRSCASTSSEKPCVRVVEGSACSSTRPWIVNGTIKTGEQLRVTLVSEMLKYIVLNLAYLVNVGHTG